MLGTDCGVGSDPVVVESCADDGNSSAAEDSVAVVARGCVREDDVSVTTSELSVIESTAEDDGISELTKACVSEEDMGCVGDGVGSTEENTNSAVDMSVGCDNDGSIATSMELISSCVDDDKI